MKARPYVETFSETKIKDDVEMNGPVRPIIGEEEDETGEWLDMIDVDEKGRCYVCGVDGEVEEMSDDEGEVVRVMEKIGEEVERQRKMKDW